MMTREEYEKTYIRMMDSMRTDCKGEGNCGGVRCKTCPLYDACDLIEIVEKWGKEHPIVTNADKYKELWGHEPRNYVDDNYICPKRAGLLKVCPNICGCCDDCLKDFWESEYIEPSKGK